MKKKEQKILIVMRHGERIDCPDKVNYDEKRQLNKNDPELTKRGILQAQNIGHQILKRLDIKLSEINLFISPFTRTIMTSLNVGKKLNEKNNSIEINYYIIKDLSEFLSQKMFEEFSYNDLLYYNHNNKKLKELYEELISSNNKIEFKELFNDSINVKYPEKLKESINRYEKISDKILEYIKTNTKNNSINIIVSHGYGVQIITEKLFESDCINGKEALQKEIFCIDFCTSYCFNMENNKLKYIGDMNPI
jgi:broad specificity phosphatase PhoE